MKKFLKQVAEYYLQKARQGVELGDYTMVFPNMRSAMYMRKYLREGFSASGMMPRLTTITSFIQQYSDQALAKPTELQFILYNAYNEVLRRKGREEQISDFDSFMFWGSVLIDDFNDIDSFLVDAPALFNNVKEQLKIQSTYLTEQQAEVARKLGDKRPLPINKDNFWIHVNNNSDAQSAAHNYLQLWEILGDVYTEFQARLRSRGLAYGGMQAREAWENVRALGADDFDGSKVAFIGFYVLSEARKKIFKHLGKIGVAEFFWDIASPLLNIAGSTAGSEIMPMAKDMPMPEDFFLQRITIDDIAEIEVCGVPSNTGQTKVASSIMEAWMKADAEQAEIERKKAESGNPAPFKIKDDAWGIIMPNDKLLAPMLTALPPQVEKFNVAMQVPFSDTPFASLISTIIFMQSSARKVHGEPHYYYKTVFDVISHPYIASIAAADVLALRKKITTSHLYNVSAREICEMCPDLAFIFAPVEDTSSIDKAKAYLDNLFGTMRQMLMAHMPGANTTPYEVKILESYAKAVDEISTLAAVHGINMRQQSFFVLLRKMLGSRDLEFDGNPVTGLQILGMQDARVLDFDNLIVLSLNEGNLPRKMFSPSLIPSLLRAAYGMPTFEDDEVNLAYQFYRLISRCRRVCLIYDSRSTDKGKGEMSRYVRQLSMLLPSKIKNRQMSMPIKIAQPRRLIIKKDERVMADLQRYTQPGGPKLSASALKTYIMCPLKFYLQNVKGLRIEDFDPEYINDASYGDIIHRVAENFYKRYPGKWFDKDMWKAILRDRKSLHEYLKNSALEIMNEYYYGGRFTGSLTRIPGEGRVLAKVIADYVVKMFEYESQMQQFRFVDAEKKYTFMWDIDDKHRINFTMTIDRQDELEGGLLRFVDYKTGSDHLESESLDSIFDDHNKGAIFQLLLYALAYKDNVPGGNDVDIVPVVYPFKTMSTKGIPPLKIGNDNDVRLSKYAEDFRHEFVSLLDNIFDPTIDFAEPECLDDAHKPYCDTCPFANLCGKTVVSDSDE